MDWGRVGRYFGEERGRVSGALALLVLGALANAAKPWPIALALDAGGGTGTPPAWLQRWGEGLGSGWLIPLAGVAVFALHALQGAFAGGQNLLSIRAGLNALARLRGELFARLQRLPLGFYQRHPQGDLIYRATWDVYAIQTLLQQGVFKLVGALGTLAVMLVVMGRLNMTLMGLTLAMLPPVAVAMALFGRAMNRRSVAAHQADSRVTGLVHQNIGSLPLIQSYTLEGTEQARFEGAASTACARRYEQHALEVFYWLAIALLFGVATALLTWFGAGEMQAGRLSVGEFVIFLSYLGQLYDPLNQLSNVGATVSDAKAGMGRVFELLDAKEELAQPSQPVPLRRDGKAPAGEGTVVRGSLAFEGVTFGYVPNQAVLRGIDLTIRAGEVIGLVGPSGSGKSTLLNLVPRFYDPQAGRVRIDGLDLREVDVYQLRANVAFVFQESLLLPATVAENIAAGRLGASRAEVEEAARRAGADDFIRRLPQGYETGVGEGAARLSVGEKQRLSMARAFLKDAPILLLDEPTSALDAATERSVVASLAELFAGRTVLMAAHRLSTLQKVDRIVVLQDGQITEEGPPEELLRGHGYFATAHRASLGATA